MTTKLIAKINPILDNHGHLIVSLDQRWIEVFGKIPTFAVIIDGYDRLSICSLEHVKRKEQ